MPRKRRIGTGPLERAIAKFGTQSALARAAGVQQQAISLASRTGYVSAHLAIAIHRATKGKVGAHLLRPDLWRSKAHVPTRRNGP
jgi:DNA-binding transcriptional regulator YdaS (Cro superfamily)